MVKPSLFLCDFCGNPFINKEGVEAPHGTLQWRKPNSLLKTAGFYSQWKLCDDCWERIKSLLTTKLGRPMREKVEA